MQKCSPLARFAHIRHLPIIDLPNSRSANQNLFSALTLSELLPKGATALDLLDAFELNNGIVLCLADCPTMLKPILSGPSWCNFQTSLSSLDKMKSRETLRHTRHLHISHSLCDTNPQQPIACGTFLFCSKFCSAFTLITSKWKVKVKSTAVQFVFVIKEIIYAVIRHE